MPGLAHAIAVRPSYVAAATRFADAEGEAYSEWSLVCEESLTLFASANKKGEADDKKLLRLSLSE